MDRYEEVKGKVQKRYPNLEVLSLDQELGAYSKSTVFLTVKAPIQVIEKLEILSRGKKRALATSFNINEDTITFINSSVIEMYALLDTITR
jgi:hypothetical protein